MRKILKNVICFSMGFVIIFSLLWGSSIYAQNYDEGETLSPQREFHEIFEQMYNSLPKTDSGDVIYPDFYAGSYIGDDGRLVVLVTEPLSVLSNETKYETFLAPLTEGLVNHRIVEFSYAQLHEARDEYRIFRDIRLDVNCVYALNVVGSGIDYMQNALLIRLEEFSEEKIEGFRQYVIDSPMIIFEQGDRHEPLISAKIFSSHPFKLFIPLVLMAIIFGFGFKIIIKGDRK